MKLFWKRNFADPCDGGDDTQFPDFDGDGKRATTKGGGVAAEEWGVGALCCCLPVHLQH